MVFPESVVITEVGPRDGLQMEAKTVPTDMKSALIAGLVEAGLKAIQVASFVHPDKVPQMADAQAVIERLAQNDGVQYSALALNLKGVERALRTAIPWIEISVSASDAQSRANAGLPSERLHAEIDRMMNRAVNAGRRIRASIQCVFGCIDGETISGQRVLELATMLLGHGVHQLVLCDTTGLANPLTIKKMLEMVLPVAGDVPVALHLHDTRGLGLVNLMAGLEMGITRFDTSLGGLGGCPFVQGAAGNIATEETAYLMSTLGIRTGIDIPQVAQWSHFLGRFFGRDLAGKLYRLTPPNVVAPQSNRM